MILRGKNMRGWLRPSLVLLVLCLAESTLGYMQFEPVFVPKTGKAKAGVQASVKTTYGRTVEQRFQKIARTTENHNCILRGCSLMGEVLNIQGNNVTDFNKTTLKDLTTAKKKRVVDFSHFPSGGILLQEEEVDTWFMMYQFEKPNPGSIIRVRMRLDNDTDLATRLSVPLNFGRFGGLWKPRVAITSPRSTMIGSEGIPPNARLYETAKCLSDINEFECFENEDAEGYNDILEFMRYFARTPAALKKEKRLGLPPQEAIPGFKPYRYGFPYEVSLGINEQDRVQDNIEKLYALGRLGAHGIAVMQDGVTVYIAGGKGGLFRFVDDSGRGDFKSGELSVAVFRLTESEGLTEIKVGTEFLISWVPLGRTNADDLTEFVSSTSPLTFSDLFAYEAPEGEFCPKTMELVTLGGTSECLKLLDEDLATVFEPERMAALKGGTTGVFKFAEMATRLDSSEFYLAAPEIFEGELEVKLKTSSGVEDVKAPIEPNKCGCVFEVSMEDDFTAFKMSAIACGSDFEGTDEDNECNTEMVANPRALTFANQFENLLIGEDSEFHENNYVWAWDPETGGSTRIFHSSRGGGITSINWFQDVVGGNNYIGVTVSEPFDRFAWLSYFGSFDLTQGQKLSMSSVPVPYAIGPKGLPVGFSRVTTGEAEKFGGFRTLFSTGDKLPKTSNKKKSIILGQVVDSDFDPVDSYKEGPVKPLRQKGADEIHHGFAFTSLIDNCDTVYSVAVVNSLPAISYVLPLKNSGGKLSKVSAEYIDWSEWGGLWQSGEGRVSPWNSHLGGEVFEPDALDFVGFPCLTGFSGCFKSRAELEFENSIKFIRYSKTYFDDLNNKFDKLEKLFNPYNFGYAYEVKLNKFGCVKAKKYLTLGRFSHGSIQVMPDKKTVYMTDWTAGRAVGGGLFKFIAKKEGDLSAGELFAAKFEPITGESDKFNVKWLKLGEANNTDLLAKAGSLKFNDIFEFIPGSKRCRLDTVNVKSAVECLKVKKGMAKFAAFLETRRYAALLGASIEFANVRSIVYDPNSFRLFLTVERVSQRDKIMIKDDNEASSNDIKVTLAECGVIFQMTLTSSFDTQVKAAFSKFTAGTDDFGVFDGNECSVEDVANPSGISTIPGHRQLLVAEDSCKLDGREPECGHVNNALWVIDPFRSSETTRIMTAPPKTSIGSPDFYPTLKGNAYITATVNELYEDGFQGPVDASGDLKAFFGYLGPFTSNRADARLVEVKAADPLCLTTKSNFVCPEKA